MKINSVSNIIPLSTEQNSSEKLNTQISYQTAKKIKNPSAKRNVKRKKLASSSRKFKNNFYQSQRFKKQLKKYIRVKRDMASYFYFLTDDLNYWHLGLALFFLPQIPSL